MEALCTDDNDFRDFYGITEYFREFDGVNHARAGWSGADCNRGRRWANRVLRKEDMAIYVLRLLEEDARVTDDRRDIFEIRG